MRNRQNASVLMTVCLWLMRYAQFISAVTSQNDATAPTVHKDDTKHAKASIHAVCSTPRSPIRTSRHNAQKASSDVPKERSHRVCPMPSTCVVVRTAQPRARRHTHKSFSEPEHSPPPALAARPPPGTAAAGRRDGQRKVDARGGAGREPVGGRALVLVHRWRSRLAGLRRARRRVPVRRRVWQRPRSR